MERATGNDPAPLVGKTRRDCFLGRNVRSPITVPTAFPPSGKPSVSSPVDHEGVYAGKIARESAAVAVLDHFLYDPCLSRV